MRARNVGSVLKPDLRAAVDVTDTFIDGAQAIFIAVGTPSDEDGSADLQYVLAAATNIGRHMTDYKVIVDKSTVPVGTADRVREAWARGATEVCLQGGIHPSYTGNTYAGIVKAVKAVMA